MGRVEREKLTIKRMIQLYCKKEHGQSKLCPDCQKLLIYAEKRLSRCKFGSQKPVCAKCSIHCYASPMREQTIDIMRYSGPKMIFKHPILALHHIFDSFK
ncbi:putative amidophosphoribosyltransferase [Desulfitispora alkaliphila]|uniref:nitrous oxide-stimulated promoter family protein n=1 Tax=Desulfitispora alkaliphila TaxID=622674 RepID=UPI003D1E603B